MLCLSSYLCTFCKQHVYWLCYPGPGDTVTCPIKAVGIAQHRSPVYIRLLLVLWVTNAQRNAPVCTVVLIFIRRITVGKKSRDIHLFNDQTYCSICTVGIIFNQALMAYFINIKRDIWQCLALSVFSSNGSVLESALGQESVQMPAFKALCTLMCLKWHLGLLLRLFYDYLCKPLPLQSLHRSDKTRCNVLVQDGEKTRNHPNTVTDHMEKSLISFLRDQGYGYLT